MSVKKQLEECLVNLGSSDEIPVIYHTSSFLVRPAAPLSLISVWGLREWMSGLSI